jgi:hypothetical protein
MAKYLELRREAAHDRRPILGALRRRAATGTGYTEDHGERTETHHRGAFG